MPLQRVAQKNSSRLIALLLVAAIGTVLFICAGGRTVYSNMRSTEAERGWVDHSQLVLNNLQSQATQLDRADYNLQLFVATGEPLRYRSARSNLSSAHVSMVQLHELLADNATQDARATQLEKDLDALTAIITPWNAQSHPALDKALIEAKNDLSLLQQEERRLLRERTDMFKTSTYRSAVLTIGYLASSLLIVVVLFLFLFRDALRRKEVEKKLFAAKDELEASVNKLTSRAEEGSLLTTARDELQLCTTAQEAHETTARHMKLLLPGTSGAILVINNSRRMVEMVASWGTTGSLMSIFDPDTCCGLRAGKMRWRKKGKTELNCSHFSGPAPENYLCVPLSAHGETLGFLYVDCESPAMLALAEEREYLIEDMCELAALSVAGLNLRSRLEGQSIRDGLTGLFNRHFMEIALERELQRAAAHRNTLAVLMMDVDHFKLFNDTFGHEAGDIVLRSVAECYHRMARPEDIVCRYGGEEFIVIMPDTDERTALQRAEMIRQAVTEVKTQFRGEGLRSITISVGVALYPRSATDASDLIRLADKALYRAKHAGRDRVLLADTLPGPSGQAA